MLNLAREKGDIPVEFLTQDLSDTSALTKLAERSDHIIVLADHEKDDDTSDDSKELEDINNDSDNDIDASDDDLSSNDSSDNTDSAAGDVEDTTDDSSTDDNVESDDGESKEDLNINTDDTSDDDSEDTTDGEDDDPLGDDFDDDEDISIDDSEDTDTENSDDISNDDSDSAAGDAEDSGNSSTDDTSDNGYDGGDEIDDPDIDNSVVDDIEEPSDDDDDEDITIDGDNDSDDVEDDKSNGKVFDELEKEEDVQKAIELIRSRVADAEQKFIQNNAEDKKKIDDLLNKISNNVKKVEDMESSGDDTQAKIAEEAVRMDKRRIDVVRERRPLTVFECMARKFSESVIKDNDAKVKFLDESGSLDTAFIVESAKVMYGFLETVNTLRLDKVDSNYIANILNNMK